MPEATVAIIAIPNSGKTTLFNRLTGAHQEVGNWPGVTVEKKVGRFDLDGYRVTLVDLPGAYAITPTTLEERIVRDYFLQSPPDAILNVVDATNLYRSLGLTLQLAMTGLPMVVAVNMMDEAKKRGIRIDIEALSRHLGVPVVPIVARTGEGVEALKRALLETLQGKRRPRIPHFSCPVAVEQAVNDLVKAIAEERLDKTFVAFRLLEGGEATERLLEHHPALASALEEAQRKRRQVERVLGQDIVTTCAQCRFHAVKGLLREVAAVEGAAQTLSDRIDDILLHRWFGLPLFFLFMFLMFQGVFALGAPLQEAIEAGVHRLQEGLAPALAGSPAWLSGLVIDGIVEGVGVVVSFLPIIALFFVFLSLIEDTGYMARAAFLMDRIMHLLRLDGKAFISILLGYGCNVPAVMGTRILASPHNRILTMLLIPFSLCSARLQVFLFLSAILFASKAPWVVFSLYGASLLVILLAGLILRPFRFGPPEPFIMELPPY
ncbi:MAG: ferrous iron transport protein B, partial [Gammaproteobacteria bacterium]